MYLLVNIFFAYTFDKMEPMLMKRILLSLVAGVLLTHLMRFVILRFNTIQKPIARQLTDFLGFTLAFAIVCSVIEVKLSTYFNWRVNPESTMNDAKRILISTFNSFFIFFIWNTIYFVYHYANRNRKQQLDTLRLEALVKELEIKTIKAHINPHFIFNSLNSIRALVDENPERARSAITALSNILRSSMRADKLETVTLEKEMDIVKDYLALEYIRFEERLQVAYEIDEDTLDQPVPPMMLQTLVENAIKHGISKEKNGGRVLVISDFRGDHHELIVRNSGQMNGNASGGEGFGVNSTLYRLNLLFGETASFEIRNLEDNMVEAKVRIPVTVVPEESARPILPDNLTLVPKT